MNKQEMLLKLVEMILAGNPDAEEKTGEVSNSQDKQMIGEFVIVRCRDAGVHAGTLVDYNGREVVLEDSRRLWYWKANGNKHSLSGVAKEGVTAESKIPDVVDNLVLPEACEIISTTSKAMDSIMGAKVYEA